MWLDRQPDYVRLWLYLQTGVHSPYMACSRQGNAASSINQSVIRVWEYSVTLYTSISDQAIQISMHGKGGNWLLCFIYSIIAILIGWVECACVYVCLCWPWYHHYNGIEHCISHDAHFVYEWRVMLVSSGSNEWVCVVVCVLCLWAVEALLYSGRSEVQLQLYIILQWNLSKMVPV